MRFRHSRVECFWYEPTLRSLNSLIAKQPAANNNNKTAPQILNHPTLERLRYLAINKHNTRLIVFQSHQNHTQNVENVKSFTIVRNSTNYVKRKTLSTLGHRPNRSEYF